MKPKHFKSHKLALDKDARLYYNCMRIEYAEKGCGDNQLPHLPYLKLIRSRLSRTTLGSCYSINANFEYTNT